MPFCPPLQIDVYKIEIKAVTRFGHSRSLEAKATLPPLPDLSTLSRTLNITPMANPGDINLKLQWLVCVLINYGSIVPFYQNSGAEIKTKLFTSSPRRVSEGICRRHTVEPLAHNGHP